CLVLGLSYSEAAAAAPTLSLHDALPIFVERFGLTIHLGGDLFDDRLQLAAHRRRQAIPELGVGDQQVVADAVIGLGHVLLHFVVLLAVDVRPGVVLGVDHAGLQALVDLGEGHLARYRAQRGVLGGLQIRRLHAELLPAGVGRLAQRLVGGELAHAVEPVG